MPAEELHRLRALICNANRILKNPLVLTGTGVFRGVPRQNLNANSQGHSVGDGGKVELQLLHSRSSYQAYRAMDRTDSGVSWD
jgi:hypothetical protein